MAGLVPFHNRRPDLTPYDYVNSMLSDFFSDWPGRFFDSLRFDTFRVDVEERENDYLVEAELPGVKKEEISVELHDNYLTISVSRHAETEQKTKNYLHRERRAASMSRNIYLPNSKREGIRAKLDGGVLTVTVPKSSPGYRSTPIEIE